MTYRLFLWSYSTIFVLMSVSIGSAQIQSDFGQELLNRKIETPDSALMSVSIGRGFGEDLLAKRLDEKPAVEPKLTMDYQVSNVFNDHVEFGLSIDPNTSSLAGRDNPQLQGMINRAGVNFQGTLPLGKRFGLTLQYYPQLENYTGEDGQLNEFDAFTDTILTELSFYPTSKLPPLTLSHQLQRLDRKDDTYDNLQRQIGFRFGKVLEYNLRLFGFDDDQTRREDFLLVGTTSHQGVGQLQFGFFKGVLGRIEYSIEREKYANNLNNLVLAIAGIKAGESRTDVRQFISGKLITIPTGQVVVQTELNQFLNSSNVAFYDFSSFEAAVGAFYKINSASWARLRLSRLVVWFDGRQVRGTGVLAAEDAPHRRDDQIGLNFQLNWEFRKNLTLLVDYQFIRNDTNEESETFDFLNYTNNIASLSIQAKH